MMLWFLLRDDPRLCRVGSPASSGSTTRGSRATGLSCASEKSNSLTMSPGRLRRMRRPVATEKAPRAPASTPPPPAVTREAIGDIRSGRPYFLTAHPLTSVARRAASIASLILLDMIGLTLGVYARRTRGRDRGGQGRNARCPRRGAPRAPRSPRGASSHRARPPRTRSPRRRSAVVARARRACRARPPAGSRAPRCAAGRPGRLPRRAVWPSCRRGSGPPRRCTRA